MRSFEIVLSQIQMKNLINRCFRFESKINRFDFYIYMKIPIYLKLQIKLFDYL